MKPVVCFALCTLLSVLCLAVQPPSAVAQSEAMEITAADTSSPRATLKSFIGSCNEVFHAIQIEQFFDRTDDRHQAAVSRILDCLDTSDLPAFAREERAVEVAICLKEILDRYELPPWDEIPDMAAIEAAGGFEQLSRWRIPQTRITIIRVEEGLQKHEYLFSIGTVDRAVDYFASLDSRPYRVGGPETSPGFFKWYVSAPGHPAIGRFLQSFPDTLRFGRTLGMANWKWPGLLCAIAAAVILMAAIYRVHFYFATRTRTGRTFAYCMTGLFPICAVLVPFLLEHFAHEYLTVRGTPLYVLRFCATATAMLAAMVAVFVLCNRLAEAVIASPRINPQGLNAQLILIGSKLMAVVLTLTLFLAGGQYLGIPVATLLASAGIGGFALALAAQDTLKTLFGTITLMADKPFRVGERIIFKEYDGVVEDIGLRSTRIRLFNSHQVTIPNDELARSDIENVGRRLHIRRVADFQIPLDTSHSQLQEAVSIIEGHLADHEGMHPDYPPRVFFLGFLPNAFTIRMMYWYHPPDYWDYLAFSDKLNSAIFRDFEESGIGFSLPDRVAHTSLDGQQSVNELPVVGLSGHANPGPQRSAGHNTD